GGGEDAVVRQGTAHIEARNCAFSPHAATFRLEKSTVPTDLKLDHCTLAMGGRSTALYVAENAAARIEASRCLFAAAGVSSDIADAVLIRQAERLDQDVSFSGRDNRFYNVSAYWPDAE